MAVYYLEPTRYYNTLGPHPPVLHIKPGDTVVTTTVDAWGYDARGQQVTDPPNLQTGPFYIEGAEPGDTLVVHLDHLSPNRERGYSRSVVADHIVEPGYVKEIPLFVGDGHAFQADGEILGTGIETSFKVQFTVDLLKGKTIFWPRGENSTHIFTVGNARPLDQAVQHATTEMLRWLQADYRLDPLGAHLLLGKGVEYDVGNVFDPAYTMVCKIIKDLLPKREG